MMKKTLCALALASLSFAAQAGVRYVENFDAPTSGPFVGNLVGDVQSRGFVLLNNSPTPGSSGFFPGTIDGPFATPTAGVGGSGGFLAENYTGSQPGGLIDQYFITPTISLVNGGYIQFYLRGDVAEGFSDTVQFGFTSPTLSVLNLGTPFVVPTNDWTLYTVAISPSGVGSSGRFAIRYFGAADTSNAIGIDRVIVQVPEPTSAMLLGLGFAGLIAARRRKAS